MAGNDKIPSIGNITGGTPTNKPPASAPVTPPEAEYSPYLSPEEVVKLGKDEPQIDRNDEDTLPPGSKPVNSLEGLPAELRERLKEQALSGDQLVGLDEDTGDERPKNLIGVNPDTGRQIVAPKKIENSLFGERPDPANIEVFDGTSFEEVERHINQVTDYRIVELPSRGLLYPKSTPFSAGTLMVRPMRSEEEEIILNPSLLKEGQVLEMIMKRCVMVSQGVKLTDPLQLLSQDRTFLLIFLRGISQGSIYDALFNCPRCGHSFETPIDLDNDLDVAYCEDSTIREPFTSILPQSRLRFEYRLPRGHDDMAVLNHIEERQKKKGLRAKEDALFFKVCRLVTGIQGCQTEDQRRRILSKLTTKDLQHIRECCDYPQFGINPAVTIECPKCGSESRSRMPMNLSFFMPQLETPKSNGQNLAQEPE